MVHIVDGKAAVLFAAARLSTMHNHGQALTIATSEAKYSRRYDRILQLSNGSEYSAELFQRAHLGSLYPDSIEGLRLSSDLLPLPLFTNNGSLGITTSRLRRPKGKSIDI
jgi:hypothetical protein